MAMEEDMHNTRDAQSSHATTGTMVPALPPRFKTDVAHEGCQVHHFCHWFSLSILGPCSYFVSALANSPYVIKSPGLCTKSDVLSILVLKTQLEQSWFPDMATLAPTNNCHFVIFKNFSMTRTL
jgi:hypothetical protein